MHTIKTWIKTWIAYSMALGGVPFDVAFELLNREKKGITSPLAAIHDREHPTDTLTPDEGKPPSLPGERMKPLRYFLLTVTAICFVVLTYTMGDELVKKRHPDIPWFVWGIWISLALNFFYLARVQRRDNDGSRVL
ncbi:hypothetical protein ACFLEY_22405 [Bradyrhizobium sp. YCK136]|uniref:hypothetical protein n=1 Tax=Bradyrhizobium sp. YCK136 TaxID=3351346 RepID=UPI0037C525DD